MARTRGSEKNASVSKTNNKVVKPISKSLSNTKKTNSKKSDKIEKKLNVKESVQVEKEEKEEKEDDTEEQDFQLPSDSDSDDDEDDSNNNKGNDNDSEESDSELAIHNDIINSKSTNLSTKVSNQSGHTIIKPTILNKSNDKLDKLTKRGVIYIGRLPNGFEEKELKKYFQQFGEITRLRLSRNKKSGNSKHYAFIEFKEYEIAKIAAETMNNYLLMGHLLKVSLLENDKIHENLFVGANTKYKAIPFSKLNQIKYDKKKSKSEWEKINNSHIKNIKSKQETLKALGIDYDLNNL
ncbi:hypothetical protein C6P40_001535 [Pichia californica]|uniref:RRM domain-containing protein n=1 Tax=Pichia californica TaxID=460514 RepID=A0A9P6WIY6_9ASCO|nr:hypothetical protein C6P42_001789 [[Candida] californica]KAG0687996.1 hypothetical protein C6P40_001535 [[Candida] californica]